MINPKELKKLAKACREAGITEYTSPEFSFKLSDEAPEKYSAKTSSLKPSITLQDAPGSKIETEETLEGDALLFWSTAGDLTQSTQDA